MGLRSRVGRLETAMARARPSRETGPETPEEWLSAFEALVRQGEPGLDAGFVAEMDRLREALAASERDQGEIDDALDWLLGMFLNVRAGKPPTDRAEVAELRVWFNQACEEDRVPSGLIDLGGGMTTCRTNLRYALDSRHPVNQLDAVPSLRRLRLILDRDLGAAPSPSSTG
jgi:hypothetical protein